MASYSEWNKAICQYVMTGLQIGTRVFLAIDEEALISAGDLLNNPPARERRVRDFEFALRLECTSGNKVNFPKFRPKRNVLEGIPPYLAFLAATVLAAYRMEEDEHISPNNYFTRLNKILGFRNVKGRPPGLETGTDEELWLNWADWLAHRGFLASAKEGTKSTKYIAYPISQTLLRGADKNSLWRYFTEQNWSRTLDEDVVIARMIHNRQGITNHLSKMLSEKAYGPSRREALYEAIYEVYDLWTLNESQSTYTDRPATFRREITAGLYRTVDPFTGVRRYHILPKQPRRIHIDATQINYQGEVSWLVPERAGWYRPLWKIEEKELTEGVQITLDNINQLDRLLFPARDFWILTPNPDNPDSGEFGSWQKPSLGVPFIILCKSSLSSQLEYLKQEELINWRSGDPKSLWNEGNWIEYRDVQVISQGWKGISIDNENLFHSLQPGASLGVSFRGGVHIPQTRGWLIGYDPEIMIHSFYPDATLEIVDPSTEETVIDQFNIKTNEPTTFKLPSSAGIYLLLVESGQEIREVSVNVIDWDTLDVAPVEESHSIKIGSGVIFGAFVSLKE